MNWQDVKWPIEVDCGQCDEFGWDNWSFLEADGEDTGERLIITEVQMAEIANALHAEVERLRATQRKLAVIAAFFSKTDIMLHLSRRSGMKSLCDAYADPDVRAAIKEASDEA